jgi:ribosome-binding protein aMBF1 (putative translation factor)
MDWKTVVAKPADSIKIIKFSDASDDSKDDKPKFFTADFGKRLERLRTSKGMRRSDLAKEMMVKESVIISLERGNHIYHGPLLGQLKKILGNELVE